MPVIAGIMPVTNAKQISRITGMSGTYLPSRFKAIVDRFGDNPAAMKQAGIAYATDQIIDLIANRGERHPRLFHEQTGRGGQKFGRICRKLKA